MVTVDDIRGFATAFPEVEEFRHFRFKVPGFKVNGKPFVGMGRDQATAVFCVSPEEAATAVADDPAVYNESWRPTAPRSFLGLQVVLAAVSAERVRELVEHAWRNKAPARAVSAYDAR